MNARERGFLLLTSQLGDPQRRPLSPPQMRVLADRICHSVSPVERRDLCVHDLLRIGYGREMAERIICLLSQEEELERYLQKGWRADCLPVTRINPRYPLILRHRLGLDSPGCLWLKGDPTVLDMPGISVVGSRELRPANASFADAAGRRGAEQGLVVVSGNARGADRTAQNAALNAGGYVISFVADELCRHSLRERVLYIGEDDYDMPFTKQRALSRNRCIHALGRMVFVAQSDYGRGGTWDGTVKNLRHNWSPVACFRDGSKASLQLEQMGAFLVTEPDLSDISCLLKTDICLF